MTRPGIVRRSWWRAGQGARLAVAGLGVVTALATTGAVAFTSQALPGQRGGSGLDAAVHRGDSVEVNVHKVSAVDSFEGVEPATGLFFRARVAGLRRIADCWQAESRAAAEELLLGKNVRLIVRREGDSGSDQILVDVLLPDGTDYARIVVDEGTVPVDASARNELAPAEYSARQGRRGLWAFNCAFGAATSTAAFSSAPSSSAPSTTTTTSAPATTESSSRPPATSSSSSSETTSPQPEDEDDLWEDILTGKRCFTEGERKTSITGRELVCTRNEKGQLRWRRAG